MHKFIVIAADRSQCQVIRAEDKAMAALMASETMSFVDPRTHKHIPAGEVRACQKQ